MSLKAVILAHGSFPTHEIPLGYLRNADHIICCDGSAENLVKADLEPEAIVGDLDSINPEIEERFKDRLYQDREQESNDLTKAVRWCIDKKYEEIIILGATGKREDHTIANISLLGEYCRVIKVMMVTDTGTIIPLLTNSNVECFSGQQISIFSIDPETEITSEGLKFKLDGLKLHNWWRASLNETTAESFALSFIGGPLIVYQKFRD
jgi:thiamine pyrophosphokinase